MKKIILVVAIILTMYSLNNKQEELIIPKEAIRFRVIANSNSKVDQENKILVRNNIQNQITNDLQLASNLTEARKVIASNLTKYDNIVSKTLSDNSINSNYSINYGMNYFPEKVYKGVTYEEGEYESLVVTLGDGLGKNWWCVLFPPLCLLEAEETEEKAEVEYKFFIKELIDKYLK